MSDHDAPYECVACGGPELSASSMQGCHTCGSQDEIVPRGTRKKMRDRPKDIVVIQQGDMMVQSIDGIVLARWRASSQS